MYNSELKRIEISNLNSISAIEKEIRTDLTKMFLDFLKEKFEVEDTDVLQVGTNAIATVVAETTVPDKFLKEICILVKPEIKTWYEETGKRKAPVFDRFEQREIYEEQLKKKNKVKS